MQVCYDSLTCKQKLKVFKLIFLQVECNFCGAVDFFFLFFSNPVCHIICANHFHGKSHFFKE